MPFRRIAPAREPLFGLEDEPPGTVGDPLPFAYRPLRRPPREVVPAEAGVVDLVGEDRVVDRLGDRITGALGARAEESAGERLTDGSDLDHREIDLLEIRHTLPATRQRLCVEIYRNRVFAGAEGRESNCVVGVADLVGGHASCV